jgi:hypothetical protein
MDDDGTIRHPGLSLLSGWLTTEQGDIDSGRRMLSELLETSQRTRSYWAVDLFQTRCPVSRPTWESLA